MDFLARLTAWLRSTEASEYIVEVLSPAATSSLLAEALIARDNQAAIVLVYLSTDTHNTATRVTLERLRDYLKANTPQLSAPSAPSAKRSLAAPGRSSSVS